MSVRGGGVEVEGLDGMIKALARVDKKYKKEAVQVFRDAAKDVQKRAQGAIGRVGRYPTKAGMIGRTATPQGAGVKLRAAKYRWSDAAEFGEVWADIPQYDGDGEGHTVARPQSSFKRRTFGLFKPPTNRDLMKSKGGYMIQPAIRARLPHWEVEAGERLMDITGRAMKQQGVKVHSRG